MSLARVFPAGLPGGVMLDYSGSGDRGDGNILLGGEEITVLLNPEDLGFKAEIGSACEGFSECAKGALESGDPTLGGRRFRGGADDAERGV